MLGLTMKPGTGERVLRYVGDRLKITACAADGRPLPPGWQVLLRTNLGRGRVLRHEIIHSYPARPPLAGAAWHDVPLVADGPEWRREFCLVEPGFYRAKAYAVDPQGRQHWPEGPDLGISIHPDVHRSGNTVYCAFARMFGPSKAARNTVSAELEQRLKSLDQEQYTVIPPSGKLRDVAREFPHIFDRLGCRILHLLPITPTPTTYARFGRFGSPYAVQDLTAIDPALVEFDKRTTGIDQFQELTRAAHERGGRVFLDIPINHTGWGAVLQEQHPEWYLRNDRGDFVSPGAWGVIWEDLVELNHRHPELWRNLAEVFLTWCRRGVDGFRCDAGYKVPVEVWRYITARVLDEFPETIFLLEGLGGSWEATEALLTEGAMQWAYSELFQNYSGQQISGYLDYALKQSERVGLYVHYSETHDNTRLAAKGRTWSLLRNRLCALTSVSGAYGFTCGVEWLAPEKVDVHSSRGLNWGSADNLVLELAGLNHLISHHPAFFDGAKRTRLSPPESPVFVLRRDAAGTPDSVLILVNTDVEREQKIALGLQALSSLEGPPAEQDLLGQKPPAWNLVAGERVEFKLPPGSVYCLRLSGSGTLSAPGYSRKRACAAWAVQALAEILPAEEIGAFDWRELAARVEEDPFAFLAALGVLDVRLAAEDVLDALAKAAADNPFPKVTTWEPSDASRVTLVPRDHWLLLRDRTPFRATLHRAGGWGGRARSIEVTGGHIACFPPTAERGEAALTVERYGAAPHGATASLFYLEAEPGPTQAVARPSCQADGAPVASGLVVAAKPARDAVVLLTNGRGGMARLRVDLGAVASKYDCLLGANLHSSVPVDRHVLAKRVRVWVTADGFITPLNADNLVDFTAGPPAVWRFLANAGDGRAVELELWAEMPEGQNTTLLRFFRPSIAPRLGRELPPACRVSLTVRVDIEDRGFHAETHHNGGADLHFSSNSRPLVAPLPELSNIPSPGQVGFEFTPAKDRQLRVACNRGLYHHEAEWCRHVAHPVEATRGLVAEGDAYSPGWFEIPLEAGERAAMVVTAEAEEPARPGNPLDSLTEVPVGPNADPFERDLRGAIQAFVVRRAEGRTVIAGYPWFLDWGRDTLIAARGLLAAGLAEEVRQLLRTFGRFEDRGTLPNAIFGEDASNRDTSDAPLWYGLVCEEWAALASLRGPAEPLSRTTAASGQRTLAEVLRSIAVHHIRGTPNGIRMDAASGLIWSPSHFTWMDTNHPAGTPREGYPVEIQALWIRLLRQLERLGQPRETQPWGALAEKAQRSLLDLFWMEKRGWLADVLLAGPNVRADKATPSDALRPNCLLAVSLGIVTGGPARRCVEAAQRHLLVPGALRSLAPLPVSPPLPVRGADGQLLNSPDEPYWGRYEGDEDTRRKPAYHNGTAWTWTLPSFCEALVRAWNFQPAAIAAARSYLRSAEDLLHRGCLGQLPEILDGDAPHTARGCDAQAWSVTETLRVWEWLKKAEPGSNVG